MRQLLLALAALCILTPARPASAQTDWTVESGTRIADATSSSTIRLADGTYRTYWGAIRTATSADGLTWANTESILRPSTGEQNRNPAVFQMSDGTFVVISRRW